MGVDLINGIGHGRLGLVSNILPLTRVIDATSSSLEVLMEIRPSTLVYDWNLHSGACYSVKVSKTLGGILRDVVSVRSSLDSGLTRVDTLAECISTAKTYFYNPDQVFSKPAFLWDQSTDWDSGFYWDQVSLLYVHLADGSNPDNTKVLVKFGFYVAQRGQIHPDLGPDLLTDGGLEEWTGSVLDNWTEDPGSGATLASASPLTEGDYAASIYGGAGGYELYQDLSLTVGWLYRFSGVYYTPEGDFYIPKIWVSDDGETNFIDTNGRSILTSPTQHSLSSTGGDLRRFIFDFMAADSTTRIGLYVPAGVYATFDDLRLQRIRRYNYYEPRLASSSIPTVRTGSPDIFFGGKQVGIGTASIINADNHYGDAIGNLTFINQEVIVDVGGDDGNDVEVFPPDWHRQFVGLIQEFDDEDTQIQISMQDLRVSFHRKLPLRTYSDSDFPSFIPEALGKSRPLFFGQKNGINPYRIQYESTYDKYGVHEIADCALAPNGIKAVDYVYAYVSGTDADNKDSTQRIVLVEDTDYEVDLDNGLLTILRDVGPYVVDSENCRIDFNDGSLRVATLTAGIYTAAGLATHIGAQMTTAGGGDTFTCTYSDTSNKFTISTSGGTLSLLCKTGTNKDISVWPLIGFDKGDDKTSSTSYGGDEATFEDADTDHVIRCDARGFKDDASGTYTGTSNALIETGADICRVIIICYLSKSPSVIDTQSFLLARTYAPESLSIYLRALTSTKTIFDRLEFSNLANIIVNGEGTVFYHVYRGDTPSNAVSLEDRDYLPGFKGGKSIQEVYETVKVLYNEDPSTGNFPAVSATDDEVLLKYDRGNTREFSTYVRISDNAFALARRILTLSRRPPRRFIVPVASRLLKSEVGDKIRMTRTRALDPNKRLSGQVFRIVSIDKNAIARKTTAEVVDDLTTVAGYTCVGNCQLVCELHSQGVCDLGCQEQCEVNNCQVGCEVAGQGCGITTCQTACEIDCQECGEEVPGCQKACQLACQLACQIVCQECGESSGPCQDTCQSVCQDCGQASFCQTSCEGSGCEETCEITCQSVCMSTACMTISEAIMGG